MESEACVCNPLERMLVDDSAEPTDLPLSLLKSITNYFSDDLRIGTGGFAVVYKGLLQNGTVAVKRLTQTLDMHDKKFQQEVASLMRVRHKNIVRFMGYCYVTHGKVWKLKEKNVIAEERERFLCFEFLPQGSLDKYISDAARGLEWMKRYQIIKGICEGLHYLHQQKIVHLDLKPANILLDHDTVPKIADFGLSRSFDEKKTRTMTSNVLGTMGYMAPESYSGLITFKSDIYSLGITIVEILTGQRSSRIEDVLKSWSTVFETSLEDTRLEPIRVCVEIALACIEYNPDNRPDTRRIIERLAEMEHQNGFMKTDVFNSPAINGYDKVKLEIMGRVKSIPSTKSTESFPVLVRLTAPQQCTKSSRVGLDLVAVLHIGISMALENRMDSVKEAMIFVIDNLGSDDRLSVVSYNNKMQRLTELSVMTDVNRERARRVVCMLVPGGYITEKGAALNEAAKILAQRGPEERSNRVGRIIFLSAHEGLSFFQLNNISPEFPVDTFGLGMDHNLDDLSQIAKHTLGLYSYVTQDLGKIKNALAQSLGGLMSVTALNVEFYLKALGGITISSIEAGCYPVRTTSDKRSGYIEVPDLYAGEQKNFIVYLNVPKGEQNRLMTVRGSYRNPKISKQTTIQLDERELVVLRSKRSIIPLDRTVCPDVAIELVRLWLLKRLVNIKGHLDYEDFEQSWDELMDSEDGRSVLQPTALALNEDVAEIQRGDDESFMFLYSWVTSHRLQRATTKESPSKSSAFRVKAMEELIKKADAEPKLLLESTDSGGKLKLETMPIVDSIPLTKSAEMSPVQARPTAARPCEETESSQDGLESPQSVLALGQDDAEMEGAESCEFVLSWLSSHLCSAQRPSGQPTNTLLSESKLWWR